MKAIIAAAGTGGHINPAIAIANEIMKKEPDSKIIFIGTNHGLETDLVPRAGYELKTIESYGIKRSLSIENIKRFFKTMHSVKDVRKIIKDFKPDVVIGTGGYICVSVMKAAQKEHVKYVLHESNVLPGVATKILAKKASVVLLGFKEAKERLPEETKTVFTGTPTKVADLDYSEKQIEDKKEELGLDKEKKLVLIFGGSQGARSINNAVKDIIINKENEKNVHTITIINSEKEMNEISFDKDENYEIMWAVGKKQFAGVKEELAKHQIDIENIKNVKALPYIYNMEEMMNIADLIVSRSGAMTITEIEKVGKGAIFIPYPYAAENHQEYNARALEKIGAAKVILDKDLNAESLEKMISSLTEDKDVLKHMGEVAKSQSIPNVEEKIYQEIYKAIND
jgi:UDP-N-acetylglucosamine--N-acetylmuramyl-(pentapeptide) pyrophosphoryl-undecaprenol N-acetylglucosamine transferase